MMIVQILEARFTMMWT